MRNSWRLALAISTCLALSAGSTLASEYECGPDYNDDGVSNEIDAAIFEAAFDTQEGDLDFLPAADHNGDGHVGVGDVYVFSGCDTQ